MKEDSFQEKLKHEIAGILLVALGVFFLLSLVSYSPMDPSFFTYTSVKIKEIQNWMGIVGAHISGLLFQGFGFSSFLIPFVLGIFAVSFILRWEWKHLSVKLTGWVILFLCLSSLLALWLKPFYRDPLAGGFIGEVISRVLVRYFNVLGASVLLFLTTRHPRNH